MPSDGLALCPEQYHADPDCANNQDWCRACYIPYCQTGQEPGDEEVEALLEAQR
jgi:hypothetical protein